MIEQNDAFTAVYRRAVRLIAVRMRSESELRRRLQEGTHAKGSADPQVVAEVIVRLRAEGYLDDFQFAFELARSRLVNRHEGLPRILREIRNRGVDRDTAARAAGRALEEAGGEEEVLRRALEKRLRSAAPPANRRDIARIYRHLTSRGHRADSVMRLLENRFPALLS